MNILYKIDSKENMRVIKFWTDGSLLCQEAGLLDGNLVPNSKECKGKNIGKSNETTPEQQAILEMNSKIADKLSEGYHTSLEEAYNSNVILPMLAKDFKKESHKEREEILSNKIDYVGKIANIRFFEYTDDGLPRFPVFYGFYLDR
jgi:DNA ligase 1